MRKLQSTSQKYKEPKETTTNHYMPIKWTNYKKWTHSLKGTIYLFKNKIKFKKKKKKKKKKGTISQD